MSAPLTLLRARPRRTIRDVPFVEYLARIDFLGAAVVAAALVVLAIAVGYFLEISVEDLGGNLLPGAGRWLGRSALDFAHEHPDEPWFCRTCKSLNLAGATVCYHGCGPRPDEARRTDDGPTSAA